MIANDRLSSARRCFNKSTTISARTGNRGKAYRYKRNEQNKVDEVFSSVIYKTQTQFNTGKVAKPPKRIRESTIIGPDGTRAPYKGEKYRGKEQFKDNDIYSVIYKKIQKEFNRGNTDFSDESLYTKSFQGTQGDQFNPLHEDCLICFICGKRWESRQQVLHHLMTRTKGEHRKKHPLHADFKKAIQKLEIQERQKVKGAELKRGRK